MKMYTYLQEGDSISLVPDGKVFIARNASGIETPVQWRNNRLYIVAGGLGNGRTTMRRNDETLSAVFVRFI